jgi:hypothetical protein
MGYPFATFNLGCRSADERTTFNESLGPMDRITVDLVYGPVDLFHEFFNRKMILKF